MMAARYGSPHSVKLLLAAGANPELKNQNGLSALDFARQGVRPDAQKILEQALDQPQWPDSPDQPMQY
jgi:ankyrin repeat protein